MGNLKKTLRGSMKIRLSNINGCRELKKMFFAKQNWTILIQYSMIDLER